MSAARFRRLRGRALVPALVVAGLLPAGGASALTFDAANDVVRARDGDAVVWEHSHRDVLPSPATAIANSIVGPVEAGAVVYYSVGVSLYQVDASLVKNPRLYLHFIPVTIMFLS